MAPGFLGCSSTTARPDSRKLTRHTVGRLVTCGNGGHESGGVLAGEEGSVVWWQHLSRSDSVGTCTEHHFWSCGGRGGDRGQHQWKGAVQNVPRPEAGLGVDHLSVTAFFGAPFSPDGPLCRPRPDTVHSVMVGGAKG